MAKKSKKMTSEKREVRAYMIYFAFFSAFVFLLNTYIIGKVGALIGINTIFGLFIGILFSSFRDCKGPFFMWTHLLRTTPIPLEYLSQRARNILEHYRKLKKSAWILSLPLVIFTIILTIFTYFDKGWLPLPGDPQYNSDKGDLITLLIVVIGFGFIQVVFWCAFIFSWIILHRWNEIQMSKDTNV